MISTANNAPATGTLKVLGARITELEVTFNSPQNRTYRTCPASTIFVRHTNDCR